MCAWTESHQSLLDHRKTLRLARELGVDQVTAIGHLHIFWWWALDNAPDGNLTHIGPADLDEVVRYQPKKRQRSRHHASAACPEPSAPPDTTQAPPAQEKATQIGKGPIGPPDMAQSTPYHANASRPKRGGDHDVTDTPSFFSALISAQFVDKKTHGGGRPATFQIHNWSQYGGKLLQSRARHRESMRQARAVKDKSRSDNSRSE